MVANGYAREPREEVVKVEVKNINELPRAKHVTLFVNILLTAYSLHLHTSGQLERYLLAT